MSTTVTLNQIPYIIPATGEVDWGQNVSNYLVALPSGMLTLSGGTFPLMADANFGTNFGLTSKYYKSNSTNIATDGQLRLGHNDTIQWRNAANTNNIVLSVDANNKIIINGSVIGSPLTTKGDLYTYSTVDVRQPVGLNGQMLMADSSAPTGLSWQTMGGAGGGSVIGFTYINANGINGTVATPTTTPTLTLSLGAITPTSVAATGTVTGTNLSGTNTGDQTITLTGDVTGSGTGSFAATLANTAVTPASYTNANITVDSKGRITTASSGATPITAISISSNNGISGTTTTIGGLTSISLSLGNITPTTIRSTTISNYNESFTIANWSSSAVLPTNSTNVYRIALVTNTNLVLPTLTDLTSIRTYTLLITSTGSNLTFSLLNSSTLKWKAAITPIVNGQTSFIILTGFPVSATKTDWFGTFTNGYL